MASLPEESLVDIMTFLTRDQLDDVIAVSKSMLSIVQRRLSGICLRTISVGEITCRSRANYSATARNSDGTLLTVQTSTGGDFLNRLTGVIRNSFVKRLAIVEFMPEEMLSLSEVSGCPCAFLWRRPAIICEEQSREFVISHLTIGYSGHSASHTCFLHGFCNPTR